ncbi:YIP1 family protein [Sphingobacterium phlebotomi]|uniref:YIP1 family protein n=1 Tax=Sphingobacterium phlebotomi TaxID=2605433 RepID=A0A5D4H0J7_9SPHI|nr:LytTR family transcriptional regulator DNA-binding domain-containing protein [Sphingobacterium phlebotomi]TYR34396.1 YIP1 family protein [Sphingobacterium phlebotomi]
MADTSLEKQQEETQANRVETRRWWNRFAISCVVAFIMPLVGHRIGEGWKLGRHVVEKPDYFIDVFWSLVLIVLVVEWIYWCTKYFDGKERWRKDFYVRMYVVTPIVILSAMFFMECYDRMYLQITDRSLLRMKRNVFQVPYSLILPIICGLCCALLSLKDEYYTLLVKVKPSEKNGNEGGESLVMENKMSDNPLIAVVDGQKFFLKDIVVTLIAHQEGINRVYDSPEHYYENNLSLRKLHEHLDYFQYRKVNRNCVINRSIIAGYHPNADKGVTLQLLENYPVDVFVSKTEVESFLAWLEMEDRSNTSE